MYTIELLSDTLHTMPLGAMESICKSGERPSRQRSATTTATDLAPSIASLTKQLSKMQDSLNTRERGKWPKLALAAEIGQQLLLANNVLQTSYEELLHRQQQQQQQQQSSHVGPRVYNLLPHSRIPAKYVASTGSSSLSTASDPKAEANLSSESPTWTSTPTRRSSNPVDYENDLYVVQLEKARLDIQGDLVAVQQMFRESNKAHEKQIHELEMTIATLQDSLGQSQERLTVLQMHRRQSLKETHEAQLNKASAATIGGGIMESLMREKEELQFEYSKKCASLSLLESRYDSAVKENIALYVELERLADADTENAHLRSITLQQESIHAHLLVQLETQRLDLLQLQETVDLQDGHQCSMYQEFGGDYSAVGDLRIQQRSSSQLSAPETVDGSSIDIHELQIDDAYSSQDMHKEAFISSPQDPFTNLEHVHNADGLSPFAQCNHTTKEIRLATSASIDTLKDDAEEILSGAMSSRTNSPQLSYAKRHTLSISSDLDSDQAFYTPARILSPVLSTSRQKNKLGKPDISPTSRSSLADCLQYHQLSRPHQEHSFHAPYPTAYQFIKESKDVGASISVESQLEHASTLESSNPLLRIHQIAMTASLNIDLSDIESSDRSGTHHRRTLTDTSEDTLSGSVVLNRLLSSCLLMVKRALGLDVSTDDREYAAYGEHMRDRLHQLI
ncbi:hypothetical protein BSLG_004503 [Batrachochytrium salamandrivorans]|nr:hypothetical protein BSLG_004503 [Batrachochytrium salamandrivorans]